MLKPELKVQVIASSSNGILKAIWCNTVLFLINTKTKSNFSKVFLFQLTKTKTKTKLNSEVLLKLKLKVFQIRY